MLRATEPVLQEPMYERCVVGKHLVTMETRRLPAVISVVQGEIIIRTVCEYSNQSEAGNSRELKP